MIQLILIEIGKYTKNIRIY